MSVPRGKHLMGQEYYRSGDDHRDRISSQDSQGDCIDPELAGESSS